jgi:hypothetical protein
MPGQRVLSRFNVNIPRNALKLQDCPSAHTPEAQTIPVQTGSFATCWGWHGVSSVNLNNCVWLKIALLGTQSLRPKYASPLYSPLEPWRPERVELGKARTRKTIL